MERRVRGNSHARCGAGEKAEIASKPYLSLSWRPADLAQRAGRIVRQYNKNPEVHIYRYVTDGTFDAYLWQTVENKQKFISQIMSSKSPVRSCDDVDETALSYAEIKALCAGNPLIKEKMDLDIEVARLRLLKADHQSQRYRLEDSLLKTFPEAIELAKQQIAGFERDAVTLAQNSPPDPDVFASMEIGGVLYADKGEAGAAILETFKQYKGTDAAKIGSYRGFTMHLEFDTVNKHFNMTLRRKMSYRTELHSDTFGNITRINNALSDLPKRLTSLKAHLQNLYQQMEDAKKELENPFTMEDELAAKSMRLIALNTQLNIDSGDGDSLLPCGDEEAEMEQSAKTKKPSLLESLKANLAEIHPAQTSKSTDVCI